MELPPRRTSNQLWICSELSSVTSVGTVPGANCKHGDSAPEAPR